MKSYLKKDNINVNKLTLFLVFLFFSAKILFFIYARYIFIRLTFIYLILNRVIGLMSRVFTNCPGDQCSIPGQVVPKTQKMVLDPALLNTQPYKVSIKGKVEQHRGWSCALPDT